MRNKKRYLFEPNDLYQEIIPYGESWAVILYNISKKERMLMGICRKYEDALKMCDRKYHELTGG